MARRHRPRAQGRARDSGGHRPAPLARPLETAAVAVATQTHTGPPGLAELIATFNEPVRPCTRAITWLTWRRSVYLGTGDPYTALPVSVWLNRVRDHTPEELDALDQVRHRRIEAGRIPDDEHLPLG